MSARTALRPAAAGVGGTGWARAVQVARRVQSRHWPRELASSVQAVIAPDAVGVFLFPLGNPLSARFALAPAGLEKLGERFVREVLPDFHATGPDAPALLLMPDASPAWHGSTRRKLSALLGRHGFSSLFGHALATADGAAAGWLVVFTSADRRERAAAMKGKLDEVIAAAERTLQSVIHVASLVGGRFPTLSPEPLTPRELEVAVLAGRGFSNVNISQRLGIAEGTVGRHLHNVFRKLGVGSRLELGASLCVGPEAHDGTSIGPP